MTTLVHEHDTFDIRGVLLFEEGEWFTDIQGTDVPATLGANGPFDARTEALNALARDYQEAVRYAKRHCR